MFKRTISLIAGLLIAATLTAEAPKSNSDFEIGLFGGPSVPLGATSSSYFGTGYFADLVARYRIPGLPAMSFDLGAGYHAFPLIAELTSRPVLSVGMVEVGLGYTLPVGRFLAFEGSVKGGGFYGVLANSEDFSGLGQTASAGASLSAGASVIFVGIPKIRIELGGRYRGLLGLYDGLEAGLSASLELKAAKRRAVVPGGLTPLSSGSLSLKEFEVGNVYPVFFKYYNDHPLGSVVLSNGGDRAVTDVSLNFYMKQYMDSPRVCATIPAIEAGSSATVELLALFTDRILEITEGTLVSADIGLSYVEGGQAVQASRNEAIRVLDRNAMSWFDDRCAAAYVTAKDPAVLGFAKSVAGSIKDSLNASVDRNLQSALALHQALDLYGIDYVVDPKSSYSSASTSREAVDFLQFPRQTLEYRAGDCDDLSILFAALLESVGIETAFLTVPGHIFMAFALELAPDAARKSFSRPDELIDSGGKSWVPVEITDRSGGFLAAWQTGAKEWRENAAGSKAVLYPIHEAWAVFEPVGLPGSAAALTPPSSEALLASWGAELGRFVEREIYPQEAKLRAEIERSQGAPKAINTLGVLYAKYGLYEKAEVEFLKVVSAAEYIPALINLGNIRSVRKDFEKAQAYYERAYEAEPGNAAAVLNLARAYHRSENYGFVKKLYAELTRIDPGMATRFAYLDLRGEEATRAADPEKAKETMVWAE